RGQRLSVTNSLAFCFPDVAAQWHPTKNGGLAPDKILAGSTKKVWWQCSKGPDHVWEATVFRRTRGDEATGCPFCAGHKVSVTNSLFSLFPNVAAQLHPTKNGSLTPDKVVAGSRRKVWWQCPKNHNHEWQAALFDRTKGSRGCPF